MEYDDDQEQPPKQPAPPPYVAPDNYDTILEARAMAEAGKGKIRGEAKMWHLSDEHFVQVVEWLLRGMPSKRVTELCRDELGLPPTKIPGRQCQSTFWQEFAPCWLIARRRGVRRVVDAMSAEMSESPLQVDGVLRDEIKQRAWMLLQDPNPPEKLVKAFLNAVLKLRDQDDRKQNLELATEKFKASIRTKLETGLAALQDELKGNPRAMKIFGELQTELQAA